MDYEVKVIDTGYDVTLEDRGPTLPILERASLASLALELLLATDSYTVDDQMRNVFGKLLRSECREFTPSNTAASVGQRFDAIVAFSEIMEV